MPSICELLCLLSSMMFIFLWFLVARLSSSSIVATQLVVVCLRVLTYMSIRETLRFRCDEGRLLRLSPMIDGLPEPRVIYVTEEVNGLFEKPDHDSNTEFAIGQLRSNLDTFITGGRILIGGVKSKLAYMKRLLPVEENVWEIRSTDPKPGTRAFGRFIEQDVFVIFSVRHRIELDGFGSRPFRDEIKRCQTMWVNLFHAYQPHDGALPNDFIKERVFTDEDLR